MRLSDIMSGADLSVYPQIGLVIFLAVFASIAVRLYGRRRPDQDARWAALPLDDSPHPAPIATPRTGGRR